MWVWSYRTGQEAPTRELENSLEGEDTMTSGKRNLERDTAHRLHPMARFIGEVLAGCHYSDSPQGPQRTTEDGERAIGTVCGCLCVLVPS